MDRFVVGFAFTQMLDKVLLVMKLRPEWQKGFLNGIGGKIEEGETSLEAMHRECREETGLSLSWIHKGIMQGINNDGGAFSCRIFYAYSEKVIEYRQIEDEILGLYNPSQIKSTEVITNLNFLIPYGIYDDGSKFISLTY